jgi:carboxyl-terminal processing protease
MRKSESAVWTLLVLALLIAGSTILSLARNETNSATTSDLYSQFQLFGEVLEYVRSDYVEKPDDSKLIEAAINGMLSSLDPHSYYLNPKALRKMQAQTSGQFGGLGLEVIALIASFLYFGLWLEFLDELGIQPAPLNAG